VGSPTDGATLTVDLGERADGTFDHRGVFIPPGVAHGFAALTDMTITYLVDGYYNPEDELGVAWDDPAIGADWYSANLHKWAHAPRSCGILWAKPEHQATLHHPIISWGSGHGFHAEFEHQATCDPTSYLAAPEGIELLREWGFGAVLAYMHGLAREAAGILTDRWGTTLDVPDDTIGAMVTVPLPEAAGTTSDEATRLRLALLVEDHIEVQLHAWRGRLWTRVCAQVYNDRSDILRQNAPRFSRVRL